MKITIDINDVNARALKRELVEYNLVNKTNMDFRDYVELMVMNGLVNSMNKRFGSTRAKVIDGQIIEYR